jgi:hypothetical protein
MANLIRSAKAGSDWTENELDAYHITVVPQNKQDFFGSSVLPAPVNPSLVGFMTPKIERTPQIARQGSCYTTSIWH